jgi:hypothetical protein
MPTQTSAELTSTVWSPVTARPTWAPAVSTPGTARSSRLTCVASAVIRGFDVPGSASMRTRTSRSSNVGTSDVFSSGSAASATSMQAPAARNAGRGPSRTRASARSYLAPSRVSSGDSARRYGRSTASAGVSVSATSDAATTAAA